jgi:two-component system cell cycle sensor histidine kinase PleC
MSDYATSVADAVLRQRTRTAEHSARIQEELAQKIRSEFLSTMSHELRTPLNTVMGFSKIIAAHDTRQLGDAEIVEYATIIHDAASSLLSVINDILDMSKIQAGRYSLDHRDVDLDELVRSCVSEFAPVAALAHQLVHPAVEPGVLPVRGDPAKLRQVVCNVLSNALKFTPAGGTVTVRTISRSADCSAIVISDTGIGMSPDDITIALTPFGQVDGSHARWRDGAGLGLPIANALVLLHEGQLTIRSQRGRGTEVTIALPTSSSVSIADARQTIQSPSVP